MAPLVAQQNTVEASEAVPRQHGWSVKTLDVPHIACSEIFIGSPKKEAEDDTRLRILSLLQDSSVGIVKITDLPTPNIEEERNSDSVVTKILKHLFGEVWQHPQCPAYTTFNVTSGSEDQKRANDIPVYDTTKVLLPHSDHAFYDNPVLMMGFYCLEGKSEKHLDFQPRSTQNFEISSDRRRPSEPSAWIEGQHQASSLASGLAGFSARTIR